MAVTATLTETVSMTVRVTKTVTVIHLKLDKQTNIDRESEMDGYSWRNREIDSERETKKKMTVSLTETVKINDTDDGI